MTKKLLLPFALLAAAVAPSCNSSSESEYEYTLATTAMVQSFKISEDKQVLDSLQNVFFSIDQEKALIFNADSLPYGTNVSRLIPLIGTPSSVQAVQLSYPRPGQADSVVDYLTNSTDSIDFSNGPVKLRVVSQSGTVERIYQISVNVHQTKPDTLAWQRIDVAGLPTSLAAVKASGTVELGGKFYCVTTDGQKLCVASTADPASGQWTKAEPAIGFVPDVESLRATADAAYMLSADGELYSTADFATWTSTGETMHWLYGAYGKELLGSQRNSDGTFSVLSYPSMKRIAAPAGFPIAGASQPATYEMPMALSAQLVMLGGVDANGDCIADAWSYDGRAWAKTSMQPIGVKATGMMMVAYDIFEVPNTTWAPVKMPALVAFGGKKADGSLNSTVYYSLDWGITWGKAPQLMQLPQGLPMVYGASCLVHSTRMGDAEASRAGSAWRSSYQGRLPRGCSWLEPSASASRVSKPITSWECPYIYMFGGRTAEGTAQNSAWRGVILRYTFQPIY